MENLPDQSRPGPGSKSCTDCLRREVECVFDDDQSECQQCIKHYLTCQPQNQDSSPQDRDGILQEFSLFARKVESRMILLQTAIELLARRVDSQTSNRVNYSSEPSYRAVSQLLEVGITLEALKVMMA